MSAIRSLFVEILVLLVLILYIPFIGVHVLVYTKDTFVAMYGIIKVSNQMGKYQRQTL